MKASQVTAASLITLFAASSFAQGVAGSPARADVKAETGRAAAARELLPPSGFGPLTRSYWRVSTTPRSEVAAQVLAARASRSLPRAGEAPVADREVLGSSLARADVKAEVLAARAAGTLAPVGDAYAGAPTKQVRPMDSWGSFAVRSPAESGGKQ